MRILGISAFGHDSAAAIVADGTLVAAVEEERFSGIKHDGAFPRRAAEWCMRHSGGIDAIAFYHRPLLHAGARLVHVARHLPRSIRFATDRGGDVGGWLRMIGLLHGGLARRLGLPPGIETRFVEHHHAHLWDALAYCSDPAPALLSIDGMGEWTTAWLGHLHQGRLRAIREIAFPHSLGVFWRALTQHLGFRPYSDEYKVMALAAYAELVDPAPLREAIRAEAGGGFSLDHRWFRHQYGDERGTSKRFDAYFGPPRDPRAPLEDRHFALAAAAQTRLEEIVLHIAKHLHRETGAKTLCLSGGVALNSQMNGALLRRGPFERIHVPPAPNDAGTAAGAALTLAAEKGSPRASTPPTPYLGPEAPTRLPIPAGASPPVDLVDPADTAAELLASGAIIGWAQGRMEFGPRALGNRSILADPRDPATRERINREIKGREWFRPLAPAILAERSHEFLELGGDSARMGFALPVRDAALQQLRAAVHRDGSARAQTVRALENPRFHRLIERFSRRTGVPAVLNTSLNVAGRPIARDGADMARTFEEGKLDALIVGHRLFLRARSRWNEILVDRGRRPATASRGSE